MSDEMTVSPPQVWAHQVPELVKALCKVQMALSNPEANRTAKVRSDKGSYEYEYADLDTIYAQVRPLLARHGIALTHDVWMDQGRVFVSTELLHESGQALRTVMSQSATGTIQGMGGVVTYLKRYGISARLALAVDRDDDANGASGNAASTSGRAAAASRPTPASTPAPAASTAPTAPMGAPEPTLQDRSVLEKGLVTVARSVGAVVEKRKDIGAIERALFGMPADSLSAAKFAEHAQKFAAPTDRLRAWVQEKLQGAGLIPAGGSK